jgi:hypothetical protein
MNGPTGLGGFGSGAIVIRAEIADDRVCSVRIDSSRPVRLPRLFLGRPAHEAPILAGRLFALCGQAHALASDAAIAAARGARSAPGPGGRAGLLAERFAETLRSSAAMTDAATATRPLRAALSATREFGGAQTKEQRSACARRICDEAAELGLRIESENVTPPERSTLFGRLWRECESAPEFSAAPPDALRVEDDDAILAAMRRDGESFAAEPRLPGRAPETGAFARRWREAGLGGGALPARLRARMIDLARCIERLEVDDGEESDVRSGAFGAEREGFSAVETSRGALYHWARLHADETIADYAIVAPTEWNFHPAGPFVAALLGARLPRRDAAASVGRLAALFDPCVPFRVEMKEATHA